MTDRHLGYLRNIKTLSDIEAYCRRSYSQHKEKSPAEEVFEMFAILAAWASRRKLRPSANDADIFDLAEAIAPGLCIGISMHLSTVDRYFFEWFEKGLVSRLEQDDGKDVHEQTGLLLRAKFGSEAPPKTTLGRDVCMIIAITVGVEAGLQRTVNDGRETEEDKIDRKSIGTLRLLDTMSDFGAKPCVQSTLRQVLNNRMEVLERAAFSRDDCVNFLSAFSYMK